MMQRHHHGSSRGRGKRPPFPPPQRSHRVEAGSVDDISQRAKFWFSNTMLCLVKGLENVDVNVELRNNISVQGRLEVVDSKMGLNFSRVKMTDAREKKEKVTFLDSFYIQGRNIQMIHIPDEVNIMDTINRQLNNKRLVAESERKEKDRLFQQKEERRQLRAAKDRKREERKQQGGSSFSSSSTSSSMLRKYPS